MKSLQILVLYLWAGLFGVQAQQNPRVDSLRSLLKFAPDSLQVNILVELASEVRYTDPVQSEQYAKKALILADELDLVLGQARAKKQLCRSYAEKGEYDTAVQYALEALRSFEEIGDQKAVRDMYSGLGIINRYQKNYQQSLSYYQNALDLGIVIDERRALAGIYGNIGNIYYDLKEYDLAKESHLQSLKIDEEFDNLEGVARTYINLGNLEKTDGNLNLALSYYNKSLDLNKGKGNVRNMAIGYSNMANTYMEMKNFERALSYAQKSMAAAEKHQSLRLKEEALVQLVKSNESIGDFETALAHSKSLQQVTDSIFNQEQSRQFALLQTRFETEKKEQQIASQENEIALLEEKKAADRRLRLTLISLAVALLLLAGFIFSRYQLKKRSEAILQVKNEDITRKNGEIEIMNQELERKALRAQMDPHFIFNSMNSIQHFITTNDKISALKYLSKFSKLIRQILENSVNHQVPIADEIKLLEHYIQLEALRFDQQFDHKIEIDENLDIYDTEIPFLLIQPYVENAIIHGLNYKDEKGHLKVKLQDQEQHILCTVEDDGVGREKAAQLKKGRSHISRGMNVTSRRLELLNRNKRNKTLVEVADLYDKNQKAAGTKVEIRIPVEIS